MIGVRDWDQSRSMYGIPIGSTRGGGGTDHVCQSCGATITLHPPSLLGIIMLPLGAMFLLLGLVLFAAAAASFTPILLGVSLISLGFGGVVVWTTVRPPWLRWRNPIVADAPVPELKHFGLERRRRCVCGASARCTEVTANRVNGIYTGTEYSFTCEQCAASFTIESPMETVTTVGGGLFLLWVASILVPDETVVWSDWAFPVGLALLGGFLLALSGRRLVARLRHPAS